jgi:hypothetical protein
MPAFVIARELGPFETNRCGNSPCMRVAGVVLVVLGIVLFFVVGPFALPVTLVGLLFLALALAASRRAVQGDARAPDPAPDA